jgi:hypothetical protein
VKPGDLVRPLSIFKRGTLGLIVEGPAPANGAFGVQEGNLFRVLINGQTSYMFEFELEVVDEFLR